MHLQRQWTSFENWMPQYSSPLWVSRLVYICPWLSYLKAGKSPVKWSFPMVMICVGCSVTGMCLNGHESSSRSFQCIILQCLSCRHQRGSLRYVLIIQIQISKQCVLWSVKESCYEISWLRLNNDYRTWRICIKLQAIIFCVTHCAAQRKCVGRPLLRWEGCHPFPLVTAHLII